MKDALVKHAHSAVCQQSFETTQLQKRASSMFEKGNSKTNEDLVVLCQNVYWLSKEYIHCKVKGFIIAQSSKAEWNQY